MRKRRGKGGFVGLREWGWEMSYIIISLIFVSTRDIIG